MIARARLVLGQRPLAQPEARPARQRTEVEVDVELAVEVAAADEVADVDTANRLRGQRQPQLVKYRGVHRQRLELVGRRHEGQRLEGCHLSHNQRVEALVGEVLLRDGVPNLLRLADQPRAVLVVGEQFAQQLHRRGEHLERLQPVDLLVQHHSVVADGGDEHQVAVVKGVVHDEHQRQRRVLLAQAEPVERDEHVHVPREERQIARGEGAL